MPPNKNKNLAILSISLASGGAEKVISLLLKALVNDYNTTLVLFHKQVHFPIPDGVNVVFLSKKKPDRPIFLKFLDFIIFLIKYFSFINKNKINISISFLAFPNLINGIISIFNKKVKTVISERGFPSDNVTSKLSFYISKLFYPVFYNRCDKLFSNSVHINRDLKENFGVKIPMEVIYNPIEIPSKTIVPESLNNSAPLHIITAGSLIIRKNQIMIIRALKEVENNDHLTILGGGELYDYLVTEINKLNLNDRVDLKGRVKNVNDYLANNNCFILSSFTEGFPNALLEAMAVGLPCISTNCLSGPLELLNENKEINLQDGEFYIGKYGLLVNNDDHSGLSRALEYLRNNPTEREKYSRLSLERASEYYLDNIYTKFNNFIAN